MAEMTKEQAAMVLDPESSEEAMEEIKRLSGYNGEDMELKVIRDACRVAVKVLRLPCDFVGPNKMVPLPLEQLREMDGQPVWVEFEDGSGGLWGIVHITIFEQIIFPNGLHCTIGEMYYGKTYKAYAYPPAHIDREAWTAEWMERYRSGTTVGAGYVCSSCDMWNFRKSHICPSCGKAMDEDGLDILAKRLRG